MGYNNTTMIKLNRNLSLLDKKDAAIFLLLCALVFAGASKFTYAALTLGTTSLTSDGTLTSVSTGDFIFSTTASNADTLKLAPASGGADTFGGTLTSSDLTANRTWTFPNVSGTVITTGDTGSVTSAMMADGVFSFRDELIIGTDSANGNETAPTTGMKLVAKPATTATARDLMILTPENESAIIRVQDEYLMLRSTNGTASDIYLNGLHTVLFNVYGTKVYLTTNRNDQNRLQIGDSGFGSVSGNSDDDQWVQSFDSQVGQTNWIGGHLNLAGGRGTGNGTPGMIKFHTSEAGSSGTTMQTHTEKMRISDALQLTATGLSKPTCNSSNRFKMWPVAGGAGVADTFEVCMKDAADAYAWEVIAVP